MELLPRSVNLDRYADTETGKEKAKHGMKQYSTF